MIALALFFCAGAALGAFLSGRVQLSDVLKESLERCFLLAACGGPQGSFFAVLLHCFFWPLVCLSLAGSVLRTVFIPALFAVRGLLLSFSSCAIASAFGYVGALISAVLFSVSVLFVIPVMFLFGCDGFRDDSAPSRIGVRRDAVGVRFEVMISGIGILAFAFAVQWTIIPALFSRVCGPLFNV